MPVAVKDQGLKTKVWNQSTLLPLDGLQCKARYCDCMSSVRLSVSNVGGSGSHRLEILETIARTRRLEI